MSLSVIMPVNNGEEYLAAAIQSALDLGQPQLELIVVDNGSTDRTAQIAARYSAHVRYIYQDDRGPAGGRNVGLRVAQSEIVGFLDADDLWTAGINNLFRLLMEEPEIEIAQGYIREIHETKSNGTEVSSTPYAFLNLGSALYRRSVFAKIGGFDESLWGCEDYDWYLRAFESRITKRRIPEVTLLYRIHPGSLTYGKGIAEIGLAAAQKKAIERRRRGIAVAPPADFPTLADYIGGRQPAATLSGAAAESGG
ncbi:MAG: glycosyltransferase family A protein, partial [Acidobacteriota bacterium]